MTDFILHNDAGIAGGLAGIHSALASKQDLDGHMQTLYGQLGDNNAGSGVDSGLEFSQLATQQRAQEHELIGLLHQAAGQGHEDLVHTDQMARGLLGG